MGNQITRDMLEPYLDAHTGNKVFEAMLNGATETEDFFRDFSQYIEFNSIFGAGVASLSGKIASRQELFIDPNEQVEALADRAAEVARYVFFAAIDEFDDRGTTHPDTHRTLAQATLKETASFWGFDKETVERLTRRSRCTRQAVEYVRNWYGIGHSFTESGLFRGMGFHMGSEILADEEFNILNRVMRARFPDLVEHLEGVKVEHVGHRHNAYYWVYIHGTGGVEADHFDSAVEGVNVALAFYNGHATHEQVISWVLEGVREFARVQTMFMMDLDKD